MTPRPGRGSLIEHRDDHALDEPDGDTIFPDWVRRRIRETSTDAHGVVVERLRASTRQGAAATPSGLAAEVGTLGRSITHARTQHGSAKDDAHRDVRACLLAIAASAILLAERYTRPPEPRRGQKRGTERYAPPKFEVPER